MRVTRDQYDARWERLKRGSGEAKLFTLGRPPGQKEFVYQQYNQFMGHRLIEHFGKLDGLSFLEVGCGRGTTSMYFAIAHRVRCALLDFSHPGIALARQNFEGEGVAGEFVQGDVFQLPFKPASFDVVCSVGLVEHFTDLEGVFRESGRVLRAGGIYISLNAPKTPPHLLDPLERLYTKVGVVAGRITAGLRVFEWHKLKRARVIFQKIPENSGVPRFRSDYPPEYFREAAERAGFRNVQAVSVNPFPIFRPISPRLDSGLTSLYLGILATRRALGWREPFVTSHRRGRTHFVWGVKKH